VVSLRNPRAWGFVGFTKTATWVRFGTASLRSSSRFPLSSTLLVVKPVILPPGRASLGTNPTPMGSATPLKTIGTLPDSRSPCRNASTSGLFVVVLVVGLPMER